MYTRNSIELCSFSNHQWLTGTGSCRFIRARFSMQTSQQQCNATTRGEETSTPFVTTNPRACLHVEGWTFDHQPLHRRRRQLDNIRLGRCLFTCTNHIGGYWTQGRTNDTDRAWNCRLLLMTCTYGRYLMRMSSFLRVTRDLRPSKLRRTCIENLHIIWVPSP